MILSIFIPFLFCCLITDSTNLCVNKNITKFSHKIKACTCGSCRGNLVMFWLKTTKLYAYIFIFRVHEKKCVSNLNIYIPCFLICAIHHNIPTILILLFRRTGLRKNAASFPRNLWNLYTGISTSWQKYIREIRNKCVYPPSLSFSKRDE